MFLDRALFVYIFYFILMWCYVNLGAAIGHTTTSSDTVTQLTEQLRAVESECQAVKSELENERAKVIILLIGSVYPSIHAQRIHKVANIYESERSCS